MAELDDYEDITTHRIPEYLARAKSGDYSAARRLLDIFSADVEAGRMPNMQLMEYIAEAFAAITVNVDPVEALNLKKPRNRPPDAAGCPRARWCRC